MVFLTLFMIIKNKNKAIEIIIILSITKNDVLYIVNKIKKVLYKHALCKIILYIYKMYKTLK